MAAPLVLTIQDAYVTFGGKPVFEELSLNLHAGDKICLIGKNGAGKTTLMNLLAGTHEMDFGKRWQLQNSAIGYLTQDVKFDKNQKVFDFIFAGIKDGDAEMEYMVAQVAQPLGVDVEEKMGNLSGGQLRRAALAHALVGEPEILMLDEPTNHMDFEAVEWLENYLRAYRGTLVLISHDRTFLRNISNKVFWLDRGRIRICPKGYSYFETWSEEVLEQERRELENREKILAYEAEWASRGISARRKRNVKRLDDFKAEREKLKSDKSLYRQTMQKLELEPLTVEMSSKLVGEFIKVGKSFNEEGRKKTILNQFNLRILRGDRIGILGKNGSGKSSFLKLLIGELTPDSGKIKLSRNIEISYFDQNRSNLKLTESLWKNLCDNGDHIEVMGKSRHVCGYLKDFMFDPQDAGNIAGTLSGGQKNRLMLAKVLANPGNCLILDEPTNDLDMDTLDMLEEILTNYQGTLFVVSHDRDFLDQTVNKILAFEGDGVVQGYVGGYSDYIEAKKNPTPDSSRNLSQSGTNYSLENAPENEKKSGKKLTYKLQYELDNLPKKIVDLNNELKELNQKFSDPEFFQNSELRDKALLRSKSLIKEIESSELRWLELEELKENL
jgi:ATP-binding cassette subfamily F protein uup